MLGQPIDSALLLCAPDANDREAAWNMLAYRDAPGIGEEGI